MHILTTLEALTAWRAQATGRVGFVPTMGNLHAGHIALVTAAQQDADHIITSIFVNRLQFGPGEDFGRYPRTFEADCAQLAAAGCDAVFCPDETVLYPEPQTFTVQAPADLSNDLCGAFRPGHFDGVCTVVLKLFNVVRPNVAVFGKKDYQQFALLKRMVAQFNLPIEMRGIDTTRAEDGLALSSRNGYLSAAERAMAPVLYQTLQQVIADLQAGEADLAGCLARAEAQLQAQGWRVQYLTLRDADTLAAASDRTRPWVILVAAYLGTTRLIDNIAFLPGPALAMPSH